MAITVSRLCARYKVDMAHARHVAAMSLALFDQLPEVHGLPASRRPLLETAALLHNVAYAANPAEHHTVGRDLILANSIEGFSDEERDMLACMTLFHRKKVRPDKEPVFQALPRAVRKETLALAALLRVGDALDYSQTQTSRIVSAKRIEGGTRVAVGGPHAGEEAARANRKADLWSKVFLDSFRAVPAPAAAMDAQTAAPASVERHSTAGGLPVVQRHAPGVRSDDAMAEAGCKVLRLYVQHLRRNEPGTRRGRNIEALHQMRTTTRRLRAAVRLFGRYLPAGHVRRLRKGLRRMTRVLGPVRDLDVFLDRARRHGERLPQAKQKTLRPLLVFYRREREGARKTMLKYFDRKGGEGLTRAFEELLAAAGRLEDAREKKRTSKGKPRADSVRLVVPALIWKHYQRVRAYETLLGRATIATFHALRIECKRLRYALELLRETLGPAGEAAIVQVRAAQDYLGELHDGDVATQLTRDFLKERKRRARQTRQEAGDLEGAADYLAACEALVREKMKAFAAIWSRLASEEFRRLLGEAAAGL